MRNIPYKEAIGQLLYLSARTRPDISIAVNALSRHVFNPLPVHWTAIKRVFRYLKGTSEYHSVRYPHDFILTGHADAGWARSADRISTFVNLLQMGGASIFWKTAKQRNIPLPSTEGEYVSMSTIGREIARIGS